MQHPASAAVLGSLRCEAHTIRPVDADSCAAYHRRCGGYRNGCRTAFRPAPCALVAGRSCVYAARPQVNVLERPPWWDTVRMTEAKKSPVPSAVPQLLCVACLVQALGAGQALYTPPSTGVPEIASRKLVKAMITTMALSGDCLLQDVYFDGRRLPFSPVTVQNGDLMCVEHLR